MRERWRLDPGYLALAVLSVVTIALLVLAVQKQAALSSPAATALPPAPPAPPAVAFVGDSFTSGTGDGGLGPANYTALLAAREGWTVTNAAADGAGYVSAPEPGATFAGAQLPRVVAARPQLVVVAGSRADDDADPGEVRAAADRFHADLRAALPGVRVVVIGPMWPDDEPTDEITAVRDSVRDAALAAGLPFTDPIAEGWFDQAPPDAVAADGVHVTDAGHLLLADRVGAVIGRDGGLPR